VLTRFAKKTLSGKPLVEGSIMGIWELRKKLNYKEIQCGTTQPGKEKGKKRKRTIIGVKNSVMRKSGFRRQGGNIEKGQRRNGKVGNHERKGIERKFMNFELPGEGNFNRGKRKEGEVFGLGTKRKKTRQFLSKAVVPENKNSLSVNW